MVYLGCDVLNRNFCVIGACNVRLISVHLKADLIEDLSM